MIALFTRQRQAYRAWKNAQANRFDRALQEIRLRGLILETRRQLAARHPERLEWFEDLRITRAVYHMEAHPKTEFNRRFLAGYSNALLLADLCDLEEQIKRLEGMKL